MSIVAFPTDPENYISNLTQLIEEIRDEMDDSSYPLDKIYRAIGRAEAMFNRQIRAPQMETEIDIGVTSEATDLPADFLALRSVYQEGSPDKALRSMSPAGLRSLYLGRSGTPQAYAIENMRLVIGPVGDASITLLYYAKLVPLTENNPTNWLLRDYPDLYLHQTLAILFGKTGDRERASDNLGIATALIEQINAAGRKARWGASPLTPSLVTQVAGTRI
jgi:hypothetical protein